MAAKEYFGKIFLVDRQINAKLAELAKLKDLATKCTNAMTGMPALHGNTSKVEGAAVRIVDYSREIDADICELITLKRERKAVIEKLPDITHRLILTKRYLCGERWEQIAVNLNQTLRWVYYQHGKALQESEKFL